MSTTDPTEGLLDFRVTGIELIQGSPSVYRIQTEGINVGSRLIETLECVAQDLVDRHRFQERFIDQLRRRPNLLGTNKSISSGLDPDKWDTIVRYWLSSAGFALVNTPRPRARPLAPLEPGTKADHDGVLLVLDNGVRIESRHPSHDRTAGAYVLVVDREGYEIGYWNAAEWGTNPVQVMQDILRCAATGTPHPPHSPGGSAGPPTCCCHKGLCPLHQLPGSGT